MATAKPKKNLGKMPCPGCGDAVAVMQSETGMLSYKCQNAECETSGFAPAHTGAAKKWRAALPKNETVTASVPIPESKPTKKSFGIGDL
jgi:ssDNA-binding Zn-finger/Zn-ribbon topoisomerase 1